MYETIREATLCILGFTSVAYLCDITARTIVIESVKRKANRGSIPQSLVDAIIHPIRSEDETLKLEREIYKGKEVYTPAF